MSVWILLGNQWPVVPFLVLCAGCSTLNPHPQLAHWHVHLTHFSALPAVIVTLEEHLCATIMVCAQMATHYVTKLHSPAALSR